MRNRAQIILRAVSMLGAIFALVGGATYALTSNTVTLSSSTITTNAALQVSLDNSAYANSVAGFNFAGIVPGGVGSVGHTFYLKNTGNTDLTTLNLKVPTLPTFTVLPSGSVDPAKVLVNVSCTTGASGSIATSSGNDLTSLGGSTGSDLSGQLNAGDVAICSVNVSMASGAVTASASSVSSTGFNLDFTGSNGS